MDLYVLYVDLTKAFETVSCHGLWKILPRLGILSKMFNIIQYFDEGVKARLSMVENDELPVDKYFYVTEL